MQEYMNKKEIESICKHLNIFYRIISIINLLSIALVVQLMARNVTYDVATHDETSMDVVTVSIIIIILNNFCGFLSLIKFKREPSQTNYEFVVLTNLAVGLILLILALYYIVIFIYGLDYEPAIRDYESILLLVK